MSDNISEARRATIVDWALKHGIDRIEARSEMISEDDSREYILLSELDYFTGKVRKKIRITGLEFDTLFFMTPRVGGGIAKLRDAERESRLLEKKKERDKRARKQQYERLKKEFDDE